MVLNKLNNFLKNNIFQLSKHKKYKISYTKAQEIQQNTYSGRLNCNNHNKYPYLEIAYFLSSAEDDIFMPAVDYLYNIAKNQRKYSEFIKNIFVEKYLDKNISNEHKKYLAKYIDEIP